MKSQLVLAGLLLVGVLFGLGMGRLQARELELSAELVTCLKQALGDATFSEISTGARVPTAAEKKAAEGCSRLFPTITDGQPTPTDSQEPSETSTGLDQQEMQTCLESTLGKDRFAELRTGQGDKPSASERSQAEACFARHGKPTLSIPPIQSSRPSPSSSSKISGMPESMVNCLKETMGEAVFTEIASGQRPPTETERQAGEACFAQHRIEFEASFADNTNGYQASEGNPIGLDPDKEACVARIMGDDFAKAKVGAQPSEVQMKQVATECFGYAEERWQEEAARRETARSETSGATDDCMDQVFGKELADKLRRGEDVDKSQFEASREKMEACFRSKYSQKPSDIEQAMPPLERSDSPAPYDPTETTGYQTMDPSPNSSAMSPSDSARYDYGAREECVKEALGANYEAYQQGQYYPSTDDYLKMKVCYR